MTKATQQIPTLTEKPGDIGRTTASVDGGTEPSSPIERMRAIIESLHERRAEILTKFGLKGRVIVLGIGTRVFGKAYRAGVVAGMPGVVVWDGPCNYEFEWDQKTPNLRIGERKITLAFEHMLTPDGKPATTAFFHADMEELGHILEGMDDDDAPPVKVDFADYLHSLEQKVEAWEARQDAS